MSTKTCVESLTECAVPAGHLPTLASAQPVHLCWRARGRAQRTHLCTRFSTISRPMKPPPITTARCTPLLSIQERTARVSGIVFLCVSVRVRSQTRFKWKLMCCGLLCCRKQRARRAEGSKTCRPQGQNSHLEDARQVYARQRRPDRRRAGRQHKRVPGGAELPPSVNLTRRQRARLGVSDGSVAAGGLGVQEGARATQGALRFLPVSSSRAVSVRAW